MDLALNNLQRLLCHKNQATNQSALEIEQDRLLSFFFLIYIYIYIKTLLRLDYKEEWMFLPILSIPGRVWHNVNF